MREQAKKYALNVRKSFFDEGEHSRRMCDDTFQRAVELAFLRGVQAAENKGAKVSA